MTDESKLHDQLQTEVAEDIGNLTADDMRGLIVYYATLVRRFPNDDSIKIAIMREWSRWPPEFFQHFQSLMIGAVELYWASDQAVEPFWVRPASINYAWGLS
jgi:hypothetical protein